MSFKNTCSKVKDSSGAKAKKPSGKGSFAKAKASAKKACKGKC